ncbi:hypothetical protein CHLRE_05g232454v5 [Chlamydomonas reinhardtii]|uniref:Uncharacterized protein n=1 Tax=Chlamydomonas reinhardtii TaxID=3055 RepID=A0A2K3DRW7_CHLRE|nr:uncharacterized protein CHLRE_05g232454v5 [Chlamydomonas reinhardtii]PNW83279.1 hypothetical protein CHLRE_05g232454v5 [Chlamydomonas reinhardtii]
MGFAVFSFAAVGTGRASLCGVVVATHLSPTCSCASASGAVFSSCQCCYVCGGGGRCVRQQLYDSISVFAATAIAAVNPDSQPVGWDNGGPGLRSHPAGSACAAPRVGSAVAAVASAPAAAAWPSEASAAAATAAAPRRRRRARAAACCPFPTARLSWTTSSGGHVFVVRDLSGDNMLGPNAGGSSSSVVSASAGGGSSRSAAAVFDVPVVDSGTFAHITPLLHLLHDFKLTSRGDSGAAASGHDSGTHTTAAPSGSGGPSSSSSASAGSSSSHPAGAACAATRLLRPALPPRRLPTALPHGGCGRCCHLGRVPTALPHGGCGRRCHLRRLPTALPHGGCGRRCHLGGCRPRCLMAAAGGAAISCGMALPRASHSCARDAV